jgi:hypothetical protein
MKTRSKLANLRLLDGLHGCLLNLGRLFNSSLNGGRSVGNSCLRFRGFGGRGNLWYVSIRYDGKGVSHFRDGSYLLLILLGALGRLDFLLNLLLGVLKGREKFGEQAGALRAVFLLGCLSVRSSLFKVSRVTSVGIRVTNKLIILSGFSLRCGSGSLSSGRLGVGRGGGGLGGCGGGNNGSLL